MQGHLWLGLACLLLAQAPRAPGTSSGPRRPRSYPHLEGDVRWRRLFSSTHFFLRVDHSGRVQGTRWRHSADSESQGAAQGQEWGWGGQGKQEDKNNCSSNHNNKLVSGDFPHASRGLPWSCVISQLISVWGLIFLNCKMDPTRMVTEDAPSSRPGSIAEKGLCRIVEVGLNGPIYRGETEAPGRALLHNAVGAELGV